MDGGDLIVDDQTSECRSHELNEIILLNYFESIKQIRKNANTSSETDHCSLQPKSKCDQVLIILAQNCGTMFSETVPFGLLGNSRTVSMRKIS